MTATADPPHDRPTMSRPRRWFSEPVNFTRGFMLACITVGFAFTGFAMWGAINVVNDLRLQDCRAVNLRRSEAADVARADVDADRVIWNAIDELFDEGIPEPAREIIFDSLDTREQLITVVYSREMCE